MPIQQLKSPFLVDKRRRRLIKTVDYSIVCERIKKARELAGLTQQELNDALGFSPYNSSNLSKIENYPEYRRKPSLAMLMSISLNTGVSIDYLLGMTDSPEGDPVLMAQKKLFRSIQAYLQEHAKNLYIGLSTEANLAVIEREELSRLLKDAATFKDRFMSFINTKNNKPRLESMPNTAPMMTAFKRVSERVEQLLKQQSLRKGAQEDRQPDDRVQMQLRFFFEALAEEEGLKV